MRIRLTKITRSRAGQEIRAERIVDADAPVIGRGSHATIHLPDPRVALEHATIFADEGTLRIVGMGTAVLLALLLALYDVLQDGNSPYGNGLILRAGVTMGF